MSCNLLFAATLLLANEPTINTPSELTIVSSSPLLVEDLFAGLVEESRRLKLMVDSWMTADILADPHFVHGAAYRDFKSSALALAEADMQGHLLLKARGTDGDLTCILRGISEDLPKKLALVEDAPIGPERQQAFEDLAYLLNDNVEVITTPPSPSSSQ